MFNDLFLEDDDQLPEATACNEVSKGKTIARPCEDRASCGFIGLKVSKQNAGISHFHSFFLEITL